MFWSIKSWNLFQVVRGRNNSIGVGQTVGESLTDEKTAEEYQYVKKTT